MSIFDEAARAKPSNIQKMLKSIERESNIRPLRTDPPATPEQIKAVIQKHIKDMEDHINSMNKSAAYFNGYMFKRADFGDALSTVLDKVVGKAADVGTTGMIAAPAVAGLLGGAAVSKLTTPSGEPKLAQKALIAAELEETLAEMRRRRSIENMKEVLRDGKAYTGRSLHL